MPAVVFWHMLSIASTQKLRSSKKEQPEPAAPQVALLTPVDSRKASGVSSMQHVHSSQLNSVASLLPDTAAFKTPTHSCERTAVSAYRTLRSHVGTSPQSSECMLKVLSFQRKTGNGLNSCAFQGKTGRSVVSMYLWVVCFWSKTGTSVSSVFFSEANWKECELVSFQGQN